MKNNNFIKVVDYDLKQLNKKNLREIKTLLDQNGVLLFKNQNLKPKNLLMFGKSLGKPIIHKFSKTIKNYPEIMKLVKNKTDKKMFGGIWHTDSTYLEKPPRYTMLYPKKLPKKGLGGTKFSCQVKTYNSLDNKLKKEIKKLYSYNSSQTKLASFRGNNSKKKFIELTAFHKLIKKLPKNKTSLYYSPGHIKFLSLSNKFLKIPKNEKEIKNILLKSSTAKDKTITHHWEIGDLLIWNNYRTMHRPINNFKNEKRAMLRLSLI